MMGGPGGPRGPGFGGLPFQHPDQRAVRARHGPRPADPARRRPRRDPAPARRGAAQRLPGDAGAREPQRRRVAAEPRLGLPRAPAARRRGPRPQRGPRRRQRLRAHRRGPQARRGAPRAARDAVGAGGRGRCRRACASSAASSQQVAIATRQVMHAGTVAQAKEASEILANTRRALYRILAEE